MPSPQQLVAAVEIAEALAPKAAQVAEGLSFLGIVGKGTGMAARGWQRTGSLVGAGERVALALDAASAGERLVPGLDAATAARNVANRIANTNNPAAYLMGPRLAVEAPGLGTAIEHVNPVRNLAQTTSLKDIARLPSTEFNKLYLDKRVDERVWLWRLGTEAPDLVRPYHEPQMAQLFKQVKPSLLHVLTDKGKGTGFFVDPRGYALTAGHVVEDAQRVLVSDHVGQRGFAKVIDVNLWDDLALLRLPKMRPRAYLALGEAARPGQEVAAIGFPRWYSRGVLSPGIVQEPASAAKALKHLYRDPDWLPFHLRDKDVIRMNLMPGNSGGPIVDATGNLTSVATSDFKGTEFARGPSLQHVREFCARNGVTLSSSLHLSGP